MSSSRPGGHCVRTARRATHLGTLRRAWRAGESLCDTSHKANQDPPHASSTPVVCHPRCNAFVAWKPSLLRGRKSRGGSRVSQTGKMSGGHVWPLCSTVDDESKRSGATLHARLQVGTEIPRRTPTDSTMLQVSSPLPHCIRRLVTTCSEGLLQAHPRPGLASDITEPRCETWKMVAVQNCVGSAVLLYQWRFSLAEDMFVTMPNIAWALVPVSCPAREFHSRPCPAMFIPHQHMQLPVGMGQLAHITH